jgi:hypothetical protein
MFIIEITIKLVNSRSNVAKVREAKSQPDQLLNPKAYQGEKAHQKLLSFDCCRKFEAYLSKSHNIWRYFTP